MDFYKLVERNKDSDGKMKCEIYGLFLLLYAIIQFEKQNSENQRTLSCRGSSETLLLFFL